MSFSIMPGASPLALVLAPGSHGALQRVSFALISHWALVLVARLDIYKA